MSKIFRALLISAVATGAAAVVLHFMQPPASEKPRRPVDASKPYVDADDLTDEQQDLLMQELGAQV